MLAPSDWRKTGRNLQAALESSVNARDFWVRSRNLRFLRFIHRLDAETTGVLLLAKNLGALRAYSELFESRRMEKLYWAVVLGVPKRKEWACALKLGPDPAQRGKMKVDARHGKPAETQFRVLQTREGMTLVAAEPFTGRTHQLRVHLAASGHPVVDDVLYGPAPAGGAVGKQVARPEAPLGLRAVSLAYEDPFTRRSVLIRAPVDEFISEYGFAQNRAEDSL
jgi:RluA family pseudouridine synthase